MAAVRAGGTSTSLVSGAGALGLIAVACRAEVMATWMGAGAVVLRVCDSAAHATVPATWTPLFQSKRVCG